jgi:hypothetical protein
MLAGMPGKSRSPQPEQAPARAGWAATIYLTADQHARRRALDVPAGEIFERGLQSYEAVQGSLAPLDSVVQAMLPGLRSALSSALGDAGMITYPEPPPPPAPEPPPRPPRRPRQGRPLRPLIRPDDAAPAAAVVPVPGFSSPERQ